MKSVRRTYVHALAICAGAVGVAGCDDTPKDDFYGPVVYTDLPGTTGTFVLEPVFAGGDLCEAYNLGSFDPATPLPKVYIPTKGGSPIAGQYPIIDTLPDKADYAPFWQIVNVEVKGDYKANDVKSLKSLKSADFSFSETNQALYCAVVDPDAEYYGSGAFFAPPAEGEDPLPDVLQVFWGTGEAVPNQLYEIFGASDATTLNDGDATTGDVVLQPVWQKRLLGFCLSGDLSQRFPIDGGALAGSALGARYVQYAPGDDMADPPVEPAPWGTAPVLNAKPGASGSSPLTAVIPVVTTDGTQATSAGDLDVPADAAAIDVVHGPVVCGRTPLFCRADASACATEE